MGLGIRKTALRSLAALTIVAVVGLHHADAATWSKDLGCSYGGAGSVNFTGTSPTGVGGSAVYYWSIFARGQGSGTQTDTENLATGTQQYSDTYGPAGQTAITNIGLGFNGSFVPGGGPTASCS